MPYIDMNQPWIYMCSPSRFPLLPPSPSHPSGSSQCTSPEPLPHASNLGWLSVSPLLIYLCQCYSLRTSHPCLLPQNPKVCSVRLSLFLFCILGYHYHLFKFHIYASVYCIGLSFWLTSLCIMGSSFIHLIRTDSKEFFLMAE